MGKIKRKQLTVKVRDIFDSGEPPQTVWEDHEMADAGANRLLQGKKWDEIEFNDLSKYRDIVPFLNAKAFRYYLPLFLSISLEEPILADIIIDYVISELKRRAFRNETNLYSSNEQLLIKEFLEEFFLLFDDLHWVYDENDRVEVQEALKAWSK